MLIFNCICPLVRAEDTVISAFAPNFRVCFLCNLQQNCPIPVTPVLVPSSGSIQNWPGAQLTFQSNECTWHRIYASSAFTSVLRSAPAWQAQPTDREGCQPAQILLGPFCTFWLNHNQPSMFMHHFYPALGALQPCWPETLCLILLLAVHGHSCASGTSGVWDMWGFTSCFLECHRPKGVADRNTAIKDNGQQEFQWVWEGRAQQRLLSTVDVLCGGSHTGALLGWSVLPTDSRAMPSAK